MFTGIIEAIGRVEAFDSHPDHVKLTIAAPSFAAEVALGESVAVNGACLTVARVQGEQLGFDAVQETLECTNLGSLVAGSRVNLERALRAGARLDGHIVQGHVDATGRVRKLERLGEDVRFYVECDADFASTLVDKGSVTIDGVSLTVVDVEATGFDVALIPHTLKETTLGDREPGDPVNLEADILGKYVKRYLERILGSGQGA